MFSKKSTLKTLRKFESEASLPISPDASEEEIAHIRRFESTAVSTLPYDSDSSSSSFSSESSTKLSPPPSPIRNKIPGLKPRIRTTQNRTTMVRVTRDDSGSLGFTVSPSLVITNSTPFARSFGIYPNQVVINVNSVPISNSAHFLRVTRGLESFVLTVRRKSLSLSLSLSFLKNIFNAPKPIHTHTHTYLHHQDHRPHRRNK